MMRKAIVLTMLLLLPTTLIAILITVQTNRPPAWQFELDKYVEYKDASLPGTMTVQLVDRASRPWNFSRDMSYAVFSDGFYHKPLSFPPEDVWCVLLEQDHNSTDTSAEKTTYTVVFVAEHQDLHTADVVIHEGAIDPFAQDFIASLSMIGCDVGLGRLPPR